MCVDHTMGITTIPKNGMLGVTEVSYHFWYDIHTSFFTVYVCGFSPKLGFKIFLLAISDQSPCTVTLQQSVLKAPGSSK